MTEIVTPGERLALSVSFKRATLRVVANRTPSTTCICSAWIEARFCTAVLSPPPTAALALSSQAEYDAGTGTCVKDTFICATLVGIKRVLPAGQAEAEQRPRVEVVRSGVEPVVPRAGDTVTARVVRINPRLAAVDILCVGPKPVQQRYSGVIRVQDVRATEIDKVRRVCGCCRRASTPALPGWLCPCQSQLGFCTYTAMHSTCAGPPTPLHALLTPLPLPPPAG